MVETMVPDSADAGETTCTWFWRAESGRPDSSAACCHRSLLIRTPGGDLHFQEYLVQRGARDPVLGVSYAGGAAARPAPGVQEAIRSCRAVLLPSSNPIVSTGTILALPGVRAAIAEAGVPCVAVSPIIGGRTVKGPADRLLAALGYNVSPAGVARAYGGLVHGMVVDQADAAQTDVLQDMGLQVRATDTLMSTPAAAERVARQMLELVAVIEGRR